MRSEIFDCNSSQDFLQLALRLKRKRPISIRELSRKLQYSSDRAFGMALQGTRPISSEMLERLCEYLKLTPKEKAFVQLLAKRERAVKQSSQSDHLIKIETEIGQLKGFKERYQKIDEAMLAQLEQWFHFPLVRLLRTKKKPMTLAQVSISFEGRFDTKELSQALLNLVNIGILRQLPDGRFEALGENRYLLSSSDVPSMSIRRGHKNQLKRAQAAIDEQSVHEREFISKTLVIPADKIEVYKKRLREVMEQLSEEFLAPDQFEGETAIYQLAVQFFRQAKIL
jgi:uncharacterized protein (TIGR02147 family)